MNRRILAVDDEEHLLVGYAGNFGNKFQIDTATSAEDAIMLLQKGASYAVIMSDLKMSGMNGIELLKTCKELYPDTVRLMISGHADLESAVEAVNAGSIFRILIKPCPVTILGSVLEDAVRQYQLVTSERELLNQTLNGSVQVMMDVLSIIDPEAFGKATLRREMAKKLAQEIKIECTWDIEMAALLSEIGRVTLPVEILKKEKRGDGLNTFEIELWRKLPEMSSKLISNIPRLEEVVRIVQYQNKNFDGSGFPKDDIARDQIPIGSRILRAANAFLSFKQKEPTLGRSLGRLKAEVGAFDPNVIQAIQKIHEKIEYVPVASACTAIPKKVTIDELLPGLTLHSDVKSPDGMLIMAAGQKLQPAHVQKIRNFADMVGIQQEIEVV